MATHLQCEEALTKYPRHRPAPSRLCAHAYQSAQSGSQGSDSTLLCAEGSKQVAGRRADEWMLGVEPGDRILQAQLGHLREARGTLRAWGQVVVAKSVQITFSAPQEC